MSGIIHIEVENAQCLDRLCIVWEWKVRDSLRPTDQEMTAVGKKKVYYSSLEEGAHHAMGGGGGCPGKHLCGQGPAGEESVSRNLHCGFYGRYGQGRGEGIGWASLDSFHGLGGIKTVPRCLEHGPGMIRVDGLQPGV